MLGFLLDLFDDLNHNEGRTQIFIFFLFKLHEFTQCHLWFVLWWLFASLWWRAFPWRSIILLALYTGWTDVFSFDGWLVCLNWCIFCAFWWISFSFVSFDSLDSFDNFTLLFDTWCEDRWCVSCAYQLWLLLLEEFKLFLCSLKLNLYSFNLIL